MTKKNNYNSGLKSEKSILRKNENKILIGGVYNYWLKIYEEAIFFINTGHLAVGDEVGQYWLSGTYKNSGIRWYEDVGAFRRDGYYFADMEISLQICRLMQENPSGYVR